MPTKEDVQRLIVNHQRRLQRLLERQALQGIDTPADILNEIDEIRRTLAELQAQLADMTNHLDDSVEALKKVSERLDKFEQKANPVPFGNRRHSRALITDPFGPPYYLLDAPAGYGKTELLLELKRSFSQEGWVCAYVCADDFQTSTELIQALAWELKLEQPLPGPTSTLLGLNLGVLLKQKQEKAITQKGLVLLIDLGRTTSLKVIRALVAEFIPKMHETLRVHPFFYQSHTRFRVVLAGRHLVKEKDKIEAMSPIPFRIEQLLPFTYDALSETTCQYLGNNPHTDEIATRIMHMSGGHPGCMAKLLRKYKSTGLLPPADFFEVYRADIEEIIDREIDQVQNNIPGSLQSIIEVLGIFRQVNPDILDFLIEQGYIEGYNNGRDVIRKLMTAYYLREDAPLMRNDNHRLLGLRRRQEPECARIAQASCQHYLSKPYPRKPETWVVEYLYQFLLSHSGEVDNSEARARIQTTLLKTEVPHILNIFLANKDLNEKWEVHGTLIQVLRADDEFKFVLNYYTGRTQYTDEPYKALLATIEEFFRQQG